MTNSLSFRVAASRAGSSALVALLLSVGAVACKKGGTGASAAADSCAQYSKALCEAAGGDASPTCASIKTTVDLLPPAACAAGLADVAFSKTKLGDLRKVCDELANKLCKDIDNEAQTCTMVREQTKNFPPDRCQQMNANYAQVLASVKRMADANKPLPADKVQKMATAGTPTAFGPADSKVVIVEFSDFQCPFCSRAASAVKEIKAKYGSKVRFVFRQFPLPMHPNARGAAEASLAAAAQGKFWEFHDVLFENQQTLTDADLEKHAAKAGLQMAQFKKALKDKTFAKQVDEDMALGNEANVSGTPTMFINGKRVANATSFPDIQKEIDKELAGG